MEHIRLYHGEQSQIADAAGITKGYLCSIVKGKYPCPEKLAVRLESVSRFTKEQWMSQKGDKGC